MVSFFIVFLEFSDWVDWFLVLFNFCVFIKQRAVWVCVFFRLSLNGWMFSWWNLALFILEQWCGVAVMRQQHCVQGNKIEKLFDGCIGEVDVKTNGYLRSGISLIILCTFSYFALLPLMLLYPCILNSTGGQRLISGETCDKMYGTLKST